MTVVEVAAALLLAAGCAFYLAGTVGLLRFPDTYCRLHALTKADNVGLFFICMAMALLGGSLRTAALIFLIWLLALLAATVSAHLIALHARGEE